MARCSNPGPAATVQVPPYTQPPPSAPGAPQIQQWCATPGVTAVRISWSPASNAEYYEIYHSSGEKKAGPIYDTAYAMYVNCGETSCWNWTIYVRAVNSAGHTDGPQNTACLGPCP